MAANDSAMQQLAQTFANLAQSVSSATKALDLSDQDIAAFGKKIASVSFSKVQSGFSALAAKFSSFTLGKFDGVFSDIGSKVSKTFSNLFLNVKSFSKALNFSDISSKVSKSFLTLSLNVKNLSKALDISDQDVIAFGKKISSLSFSKIQSGFALLSSKFSNFTLGKFDKVFSEIGSKVSKTFSNSISTIKNFSKSLGFSDQNVITFGEKINSISFSEIQANFSSLASKISNFSLNSFNGVFSEISSKVSKTFSNSSATVKNFSKALDLSDQDIISFGEKIASISFAKIQTGFNALTSKVANLNFSKIQSGFGSLATKVANLNFSKIQSGLVLSFGSVVGSLSKFRQMITGTTNDSKKNKKKPDEEEKKVNQNASGAIKGILGGASAAMMRVALIGGAGIALAAKGIVVSAKGIIKGIELAAKGIIAVTKGLFTGISGAAMAPVAAFGAVTGAFTGIIDIASKFVSALNPGIIEQLQLAFDDLFAVVGRAFVPVMAAVIPIVRTFADALVPVIQSLMPTFKVLADTMTKVAIPVIAAFAGVLFTMSPFFKLLAEAVGRLVGRFAGALIPIIEKLLPLYVKTFEALLALEPALTKLLDTVIQMVLSLLPPIVDGLVPIVGFLAETFGGLVSIVADAVKALTDFSVATIGAAKSLVDGIADWVIETFIGDLKQLGFNQPNQEATKKPGLQIPKFEQDASRGAAARGASFIGFADYGRQLMEAAFGSGANTPEMRTAEAAEKMANGIDQLVQQGDKNAPQFNINQLAKGVR